MIFAKLCAVTSLLLTTPAHAYQGLELGRDCRSSDDVAQARCESYINGFLAGAQLDIDGEPIPMWRYYGYSWCGPVVVEVPVVIDALFEAARAGSAIPHFPAPLMLAQSLSDKFPCEEFSAPSYQGFGPPQQ